MSFYFYHDVVAAELFGAIGCGWFEEYEGLIVYHHISANGGVADVAQPFVDMGEADVCVCHLLCDVANDPRGNEAGVLEYPAFVELVCDFFYHVGLFIGRTHGCAPTIN